MVVKNRKKPKYREDKNQAGKRLGEKSFMKYYT